MILAFEMTWTGSVHAPVNSAILQTIALAVPNQELHVFADTSHLRELQQDGRLAALRKEVHFVPITVSKHYLFRPQIVSVRRFVHELATLCAGVRRAPRHQSCTVVLLSATPTAILAASMLSRLRGGRLGVRVILHGNLNDISGWRPRNPLTRMFDLRATLAAHHPPWLQFIVLEPSIKDEMAKQLPATATSTRVLPHPVNVGEIDRSAPVQLELPLQIGFIGLATDDKGIDFFLEIAADFKMRYGQSVKFHLVGRVPPSIDLARFAVLDSSVSYSSLPRAEFKRRLASLHFAFLPYRNTYYEKSASGALIDAITWLKPLITRRLPVVEQLFAHFGEIGYLCNHDVEMRQALDEVITNMDKDRYARQVAALRMIRATRTPEALAADYRSVLTSDLRTVLGH